jgi:hypothetical protein
LGGGGGLLENRLLFIKSNIPNHTFSWDCPFNAHIPLDIAVNMAHWAMMSHVQV